MRAKPFLEEFGSLPAMRVLLFTGKGGVGKTTVAAATAVRAANEGHRTIICSTDPAHSLADAFDVPLGDEPVEIPHSSGKLFGQQLDARARMEQSWGEVQDYLTQVLSWAGADAIEAEELSVIPGLDEVFALAEIKSFASSGEWDVVVVDCAPTAETIRLLSLPDILSWYMQRIFPTQRKATRAVRPLLSRVMNLPIASEAVFGAMRRFYDRLDGIREILGDPTVTSARLVVNPERLVIAEARRTYSYLALFGYHVDAVIANRVLPEEVTDPWFDDLRLNQAARMVEIERDFAEVEVIRVPLRSHEPIGTERLEAIAEILYGDRESAVSVLSPAQSMKIRKSGQAVIVEIPVPLAEREDLDIGRSEAELFVTLGQYRRSIALPDSVARRTISHAELRNGKLRIRFEGE